jgi:hypothetical protein
MKRNWSIERVLAWKMYYWGPAYKTLADVLPPRSVVRLKHREPDWEADLQVGMTFRIGYYSPQDGPDCVWLVDAAGGYFHTWDQVSLLDTFEVVERSNETDLFGNNQPRLGPLA